MNDKKAKKFIEQLLNHNPESRLNGSFLNLKSDLWLEGINWESLETRMYSTNVHVPFQPKFKEKYDALVMVDDSHAVGDADPLVVSITPSAL